MKIYCDASFDEKNKIAGVGIVIEKGGCIKKPISFWVPANTNNIGEMFGVYISSVLSGGEKCTIYTDSQTALDYINGERNKEYERTHKPFWNKQQYINHKQMLVMAYKIKKVSPNIKFEKVKGHTKNFKKHGVANNISDMMARFGRSKFYEK